MSVQQRRGRFAEDRTTYATDNFYSSLARDLVAEIAPRAEVLVRTTAFCYAPSAWTQTRSGPSLGAVAADPQGINWI